MRVVDGATGRALPNAQVAAADGARWAEPRLTDESGRARVPAATGDSLRVRVRQIGYAPAERTVATAAGEVVIRLGRVAVALPAQRATGATSCAEYAAADDREGATALYARLRQAAEQYEAFRRAYPFEAHVENRLAGLRTGAGRSPVVQVRQDRFRSDRWAAAYDPGGVVRPSGNSFHADILFVSTLADDRFWQHHCFAVDGVSRVAGRPAVRLTFAPAGRPRGPDWAGAAYLDTATSELVRVEFRLERGDRYSPKRLEGYTTFMTPSPFVAVPESTLAVWWERGPAQGGDWGTPDAVQLVHVQRLAFRSARPPAAPAPAGGPPVPPPVGPPPAPSSPARP